MILNLLIGLAAPALLIATGWPLARYLGARPVVPAAWIVGVLSLYQVLFLCQIAGLSLDLFHASCGLLIVFAVPLFFLRKRDSQPGSSFSLPPRGQRLILVLSAFSTVLVAIRAFRQPLSGPDTPFRWDLLAIQTLKLKQIDFYPPQSPADFGYYFYPDGLSPLSSWCHWWVYSLCGEAVPNMTFGMLALCYGIILVLAFRTAKKMADQETGYWCLFALASSPLLVWIVAQGQESGFTTLGVIATAYYLLCSREAPRAALLAGFGSSIAVLSREYGWIFFGAGLATGILLKLPRRSLLFYSLATLLCAGPWYARNFYLGGNPFYSLNFLGLFPVNPVLTGILKTYALTNGWPAIGAGGTAHIAGHLIQLAPLPFLAGALFLPGKSFRPLWLSLSVGSAILVWAISVPYTSSGSFYTYRVLGPALVLLAIPAGMALSAIFRRFPRVLIFFAALLALYGTVNSWTSPFLAKTIEPQKWFRTGFESSGERLVPDRYFLNEPFPGRVLTDNAYLHANAVNVNAGPWVAAIWSPEFLWLFNSEPEETRAVDYMDKLRSLGIARVAITPDSVNWPYLSNFPFFRDYLSGMNLDENGWRIVPEKGEL